MRLSAALQLVKLPREGTPVPFELKVELAQGHELVFLPLIPEWHYVANFSIEGLTITQRSHAFTTKRVVFGGGFLYNPAS